jgi:ABC-type multidrug transport system permease subunit
VIEISDVAIWVISSKLPQNQKKIGSGLDEGESYKSLTSTYNHPHDAGPASTKPEYSWLVVLPTVIQVIAIGIFICGVTLQLLKYFGVRF